MSTTEERIARMHSRAGEIRKQKVKRKIQIESAVTGALGVFMVALVVMWGTSPGGFTGTTTDTGFAGASVLDASLGIIILLGVVAFLFIVVLALLIRSFREKKRMGMEDAR